MIKKFEVYVIHIQRFRTNNHFNNIEFATWCKFSHDVSHISDSIEIFIFVNSFRVLLKEADIHLVMGRRYGFTGRNGLGKTTLLKMLSR